MSTPAQMAKLHRARPGAPTGFDLATLGPGREGRRSWRVKVRLPGERNVHSGPSTEDRAKAEATYRDRVAAGCCVRLEVRESVLYADGSVLLRPWTTHREQWDVTGAEPKIEEAPHADT